MTPTIGQLMRESCVDPGYGGCIPTCAACRAREIGAATLEEIERHLAVAREWESLCPAFRPPYVGMSPREFIQELQRRLDGLEATLAHMLRHPGDRL